MATRRNAGSDGKGPDSRNSARHDTGTSGIDGAPGHAILTETEEALSAGMAALSNMCMRDDGYLRLIPDADGKTLWAKWKYTRGAHAGHYVLSRVYAGDWPCALRILVGKMTAVDAGAKRPTRDTAYD